jgi:hypothetical protein
VSISYGRFLVEFNNSLLCLCDVAMVSIVLTVLNFLTERGTIVDWTQHCRLHLLVRSLLSPFFPVIQLALALATTSIVLLTLSLTI